MDNQEAIQSIKDEIKKRIEFYKENCPTDEVLFIPVGLCATTTSPDVVSILDGICKELSDETTTISIEKYTKGEMEIKIEK